MAVTGTTNWSDPTTCPFCGGDLATPGAGFVDHLSESPDCETHFDRWRDNLAGDLAGEWSG